MTRLAPCTACHRHVALDAPCPFCGADAPPIAHARTVPMGAARAVIFSLGVAVGGVGCGATTTTDAGSATDAGSIADAGSATDAGRDAGTASADAGNVAMPYGAPPADHLL